MKTIRLVPLAIAFCTLGCASTSANTDPLPDATAIDIVAPADAKAIAAAKIVPDNVDAAFEELVREIEGGK